MAYRLGNPYTVALFVAAGASVGAAILTLRHRRQRAGRALFGFLVGTGIWSLADGMRYAATTLGELFVWNRVGYAGIVVVPPTLLLFGLAYTRRERWFRPRYVAALASISVLAYLTVLTNPGHGLWFTVESVSPGTAPPVLQEDWGAAWYLWAVYSYGVILLVTVLVGTEFFATRQFGHHRVQTGLVLGGLLVGSAANLLFLFDVAPFDPAPFVVSFIGLTFGLALFRYQLLTIVPFARDAVVRTMDSGVLVVDDADRIVDLNERAQALLDLEADAAVGQPIADALRGVPSFRACLRAGGTDETVTVEAGGGERHLDVDVSVLEDTLESSVGRVAVVTDVTPRVERERALRERTRELEVTNERLDEFAGVVSHDLRNPLNVVQGRVEMAREASDPEPHLDEIDDAATRMASMIDDLLTLCREGRTVGSTEPVSLEAAAERAWSLGDLEAATLTCEASGTVRADPDRLQELLGNLFRNSAEHATEDGAAGSVTVRVLDTPDGFAVEDDGPGVPPEERDRVFDLGYTTDPDGTGFGLNIVKNVAEAHGWSVTVTESPEGGARFEVTGVERA